MRVVVTRPESSARRTERRLVELGHQPVSMPLAWAHHYPDIAEKALKAPHAALAVTSGEAVRVLSSVGERLSAYRDDILYAVGASTARAAEDAGFRNIRTGSGTGAALAERVASGAPLDNPLLYLAGRPRSSTFEEGLRAAGLPFITAEVYKMTPVVYDAQRVRDLLCDPPADAVLLYSRETARLFFDLAMPFVSAATSPQMLCLSETVCEAVPSEFHGHIKIAAHPDEDGILALL